MKKIAERASLEHQGEFVKTWKLRDDLANDPYWIAAYEYARDFKLTIPELNIVGEALVRK